jgi:hypothetical protein
LIQATPQSTPTPATAPALAQGGRAAPSASAIYDAFKAERRELNNQLEDLQNTREKIVGQLDEVPAGSTGRQALEARLSDVDKRISTVDQMLAANSAQIAQAAAIPGAVVPPTPAPRQGPPQEVWVFGAMFMVLVLFPITIAFARRIWRRSAAAVTSFPKELAERLSRMEHAVEATAVEVERIGEGQRFLTRLFTEGEGARALGSGAAVPVERKPPNRLP